MRTIPASDFLFSLLHTPSPTGFEQGGMDVWADFVRPFLGEVHADAYGSHYGTLANAPLDDRPLLMLTAHGDEIGCMVQHITDQGFLHVVALGGSDKAIIGARTVQVFGDKGPVDGVLGQTAIHLKDRGNDKAPEWSDLFIDIGATNRAEVLERGIRVGAPAVLASGAARLGDRLLTGRALDNRINGYVMARVVQALAEEAAKLPVRLVAAYTVQEEIGGHGARMLTHRLNPDAAIVLDVTHATDTPGISQPKHGKVTLGGGLVLTHGSANHTGLVRFAQETAARCALTVQHETAPRYTSTDTDDVFVSRSGVPAILLSQPLRYMHSPVETVDLQDQEDLIMLITEMIRGFRPSALERPALAVQ